VAKFFAEIPPNSRPDEAHCIGHDLRLQESLESGFGFSGLGKLIKEAEGRQSDRDADRVVRARRLELVLRVANEVVMAAAPNRSNSEYMEFLSK